MHTRQGNVALMLWHLASTRDLHFHGLVLELVLQAPRLLHFLRRHEQVVVRVLLSIQLRYLREAIRPEFSTADLDKPLVGDPAALFTQRAVQKVAESTARRAIDPRIRRSLIIAASPQANGILGGIVILPTGQ